MVMGSGDSNLVDKEVLLGAPGRVHKENRAEHMEGPPISPHFNTQRTTELRRAWVVGCGVWGVGVWVVGVMWGAMWDVGRWVVRSRTYTRTGTLKCSVAGWRRRGSTWRNAAWRGVA